MSTRVSTPAPCKVATVCERCAAEVAALWIHERRYEGVRRIPLLAADSLDTAASVPVKMTGSSVFAGAAAADAILSAQGRRAPQP